MKKALSLLFLFVVLLFRVSADTSPPGTEPEYYYTRVMYSGVGTPERGGPFPMRYEPLRDFKCSDLERGEGGLGEDGAPTTPPPTASLSGVLSG